MILILRRQDSQTTELSCFRRNKMKKIILIAIWFIVTGMVLFEVFTIVERSKPKSTLESTCAEWQGKPERFNYKGYDIFFCYKQESK
jgi:hypothetical protein